MQLTKQRTMSSICIHSRNAVTPCTAVTLWVDNFYPFSLWWRFGASWIECGVWFVDISLFKKPWKSLSILKKIICISPHVSMYPYVNLYLCVFIHLPICPLTHQSIKDVYVISKNYLLHIPFSIKYCHWRSEPHSCGKSHRAGVCVTFYLLL